MSAKKNIKNANLVLVFDDGEEIKLQGEGPTKIVLDEGSHAKHDSAAITVNVAVESNDLKDSTIELEFEKPQSSLEIESGGITLDLEPTSNIAFDTQENTDFVQLSHRDEPTHKVHVDTQSNVSSSPTITPEAPNTTEKVQLDTSAPSHITFEVKQEETPTTSSSPSVTVAAQSKEQFLDEQAGLNVQLTQEASKSGVVELSVKHNITDNAPKVELATEGDLSQSPEGTFTPEVKLEAGAAQLKSEASEAAVEAPKAVVEASVVEKEQPPVVEEKSAPVVEEKSAPVVEKEKPAPVEDKKPAPVVEKEKPAQQPTPAAAPIAAPVAPTPAAKTSGGPSVAPAPRSSKPALRPAKPKKKGKKQLFVNSHKFTKHSDYVPEVKATLKKQDKPKDAKKDVAKVAKVEKKDKTVREFDLTQHIEVSGIIVGETEWESVSNYWDHPSYICADLATRKVFELLTRYLRGIATAIVSVDLKSGLTNTEWQPRVSSRVRVVKQAGIIYSPDLEVTIGDKVWLIIVYGHLPPAIDDEAKRQLILAHEVKLLNKSHPGKYKLVPYFVRPKKAQ